MTYDHLYSYSLCYRGAEQVDEDNVRLRHLAVQFMIHDYDL